jgi:hypothetical protein
VSDEQQGPSRRIGWTDPAAVAAAQPIRLVPESVRRATQEYERAVGAGVHAGLTDEQVREVIRVWSEFYRTTTAGFSWDVVRRAILSRACGDPWTPVGMWKADVERWLRSMGAIEEFGIGDSRET